MEKLILKVKRGALAKEFPLLKIAKHGDVGLDVAIALPYKDESEYKDKLHRYYAQCNEADIEYDHALINELKHGKLRINPGCRLLVPTDIRIEIPDGYWVAIEARSSTSKLSLMVPKGVIDTGYRGELFAQVINVGNEPVYISHGDRLIQLIIHKNETDGFVIEEVDELSESERGESGFGSSGSSAIHSGR